MKVRAPALLAVAVALVAAPPAAAKFRITLELQPKRPWVKRPLTVTMRTDIALPQRHGLRLVAIGPRGGMYQVLTAVERGRAIRRTVGFGVPLTRTGPKAYTATVRFPRGGRWRLVVPNWGAPGFAYRPPVVRPVVVRPGA